MPTAARSPSSTPTPFAEPPTSKQAAELLDDSGATRSRRSSCSTATRRPPALSFRNMWRVIAMPVEDAGVADIIGAASLLISEAALAQITARAAGTGEQAGTAEEVAA